MEKWSWCFTNLWGKKTLGIHGDVYIEFLSILTFKDDGTAILKDYDADEKKWERHYITMKPKMVLLN